MSRKKIVHSLPPLPRRRGRRDEVTDHALLEILRRLAGTHQKPEPQLFYPVRDAAKQLGAPISAVSRVYGMLKKEGILGSVRGSRTILEARGPARRLTIKSFVGLPVSRSCLMTLLDYEKFYSELRREGLRRGFLCNFILFQDDPSGLSKLQRTLEEFRFDSIIWFLPRITFRDTILRLRDQGIRIIGIADGGVPGIRCRYEIQRLKALETILSKWRSDFGITSVSIVHASERSTADEEMIEHAVDNAQLEYRRVHLQDDAIIEVASSLAEDPTKGIILPAAAASRFSMVAPRGFANLLKKCRVVLPDGPVPSTFGPIPRAPVDLVTVDWCSVAKRIVRDLSSRQAYDETRSIRLEATPVFQVPLHQYADSS